RSANGDASQRAHRLQSSGHADSLRVRDARERSVPAEGDADVEPARRPDIRHAAWSSGNRSRRVQHHEPRCGPGSAERHEPVVQHVLRWRRYAPVPASATIVGTLPVLIRLHLAAWLVFALASPAWALDPSLDARQYAHTSWKIRDGFVSGTILAITQTTDGYLWIGTDAGLFRFDGVRAVRWQPRVAGAGGVTHVRALLGARDGTLWINTGASIARLKDGDLIDVPVPSDTLFNAFLEDREGQIWIGAGSPSRFCLVRTSGLECSDGGGTLGRALLLFEDSKGNLWAGSEAGTARVKPGRRQLFPLPPQLNGYMRLTEENGVLLVGVPDGVARFIDGRTELAYRFPPATSPLSSAALLRDRDGGVWVGVPGRGVVHFHNGRTDVFNEADGLSGDSPFALFEDREGSIWVVTREGLDRFRDVVVPTYSGSQTFSNGVIASVLAATDGAVWVATFDGLNRWQSGRLTVYREQHGPTRPGVREVVARGFPERGHALFQDARGRIWVSDRRGAGYLDGDRFVPVWRRVAGDGGGTVAAIAGDRHDDVWISMTEG